MSAAIAFVDQRIVDDWLNGLEGQDYDLPDALADLRTRLDLSQKEFAKLLQVDMRLYAEVERRRREPGAAFCRKALKQFPVKLVLKPDFD